MKTWFIAAAFAATAGLAQAQDISGVFQTQANDEGNFGFVQFYDCGGKYCGRLVKSFNAQKQEIQSPNNGKNIVANMTSDGGGKFSGGTIWDPGSNKTYKSKMTLNGSNLSVSGCVAVFCRTQAWVKVQ